MNGPLQGRTSILSLDDSRANTFPSDYDTDLESPWNHQSEIILKLSLVGHPE